MLTLLDKLRKVLSPADKWGALALVALMAFGAMLELAALGIIMILVSAFASPDIHNAGRSVRIFYDLSGMTSPRSFVIFASVFVIVLYCFKNLYCYFLYWIQNLYVTRLSCQFSRRMYHNYLAAPYSWHMSTGATELINRINQVSSFAHTLLRPIMLIITECFVVFALFGCLIVFAPGITLGTLAAGTVLIGAFYLPLRKILTVFGKKELLANEKAILFLNQGLAAVREVKLTGTEKYFEKQLDRVQKERFYARKRIGDFSEIPRFAMEAFSIAVAMSILIALILSGMQLEGILVFGAMFITAMFRLLPSFSRIQYNLFTVRSSYYLFDRIYEDLTALPAENKTAGEPTGPEIEFRREISVRNATFAYRPDAKPVLNNISLDIRWHESVAFVGKTGCGKTTLADIIMGFRTPSSGEVLVDGIPIKKNIRSWRSRIGYVPQNIVLFDDTLRNNIAFGVEPDAIDENRLSEVMRMAQVTDFLPSLPDGENTVLGESGLRLSGGQRQRIAIARALYSNPELLILDEATSALDNDTEKALIDALKGLKGRLTILMIAHRLTSIKHCDRIISLDPVQ